MARASRKVVILVAGMHRSGTSAVARVASLLGFALPKTLLQPNAANERGYWESVPVNRLNDEIFAHAGVDWRAWRPLRAGWSDEPAARELKAKALALLESEFGDAQHLVLKDPRFCRLVEFWREVIDDFGGDAVVVSPIRNPLEVAASLDKRNLLVPALAHTLWLRYVLEAESGSRGMRRSFQAYDALLRDWRPVVQRMKKELGISWPRPVAKAQAEIDAFLSSEHRHHALAPTSVMADPALPKRLRSAFAIFERWAREGERRTDFAALDRIRRGLDVIPADLRPIVSAGHENMEKARRLRIRFEREAPEAARREAEAKAAADAQLAELTAKLAEGDARIKADEARLADAAQQLAERDAEVKASAARLAGLQSDLVEAQRSLGERDAQLEAGEARLADVTARLSRIEQLVADLESRLAQAARDLEASKTEASAAAERAYELKGQLLRTAGVLVKRENAAKLSAKLAAQELALVRSQLAETARLLGLRDAVANANAEQLEQVKAQLVATEVSVAKREMELSERYNLLKRANATAEKARADLERVTREREEARRQLAKLKRELQRIRSSRAWKTIEAIDSTVRRAKKVLARIGPQPDQRAALVASSKFFDRDWYTTFYPDVAAAGIDPALHYVRYGAAEGRDPGPGFSTRWYLQKHDDVAAAGMNPLLHYLLHGMAEGRAVKASSVAKEMTAAPAAPATPYEPPLAAAEPLSLPRPIAAPAVWTRQKDLALEAITDDSTTARAAFCMLLGIDAALPDVRACPVVSLGAAGLALADVWHVTDRHMRLRFSPPRESEGQPCVARFFQHDLSAGAKAVMVGESYVEARGPQFADIALSNAFLPVLMTLATPHGHLLAASLLPFPSLCRGGAHYAELCAAGTAPSYFENLQEVSRALLIQRLGDGNAAQPFSLARIDVDLQEAIGTERIFAADLRAWLAAVMHVRVRPAEGTFASSPRQRAYLEESLAPLHGHAEDRTAARERAGKFALTLPADSIPSIHALVSRTLGGGPARVGSYVVAERSTSEPQWTVAMPPVGEELIASQPAMAGPVFPLLARLSPQAGDPVEHDTAELALAVRFCEARSRHPASLIMPVAPDRRGPVLLSAPRGEAGERISVLLAAGRAPNALAALLESLKLQTAAPLLEIVAVMDGAQNRKTIEPLLERYFAGSYRLVEGSDASGNAGINRAAESAAGKLLLIVGAGVILHDARTLETLATIADHERVASGGCMLLRTQEVKNVATPTFRSAGIFPGSGSGFSELDCLAAFPFATYPVLANSSALCMVRAEAWRRLGGFDAARFPDLHADLDYGIRALTQGFLHLCTTGVSAELVDADFPPPYADVELPTPRGLDLAASATVLKRLKG